MEEIILFLSVVTLCFVLLVLYNNKSNRLNRTNQETFNHYYNQVPSSYRNQNRHSGLYEYNNHQNQNRPRDHCNDQRKKEYCSSSYIANNTIEKSYPHYHNSMNRTNKDSYISKENDVNYGNYNDYSNNNNYYYPANNERKPRIESMENPNNDYKAYKDTTIKWYSCESSSIKKAL